MNDFAETPLDVPPPRRPRGHPWLAWLAIAALAGLFLLRQLSRGEAAVGAEETGLSRIVTSMQLRYLIGAADALPDNAKELYEQAQAMNQGPIGERLRFIVAAGDLGGPAEALRQLDALDALIAERQATLTAEQERLRDVLRRLYADYARGDVAAPGVTAEERTFLVEQLEWFGRLALTPPARADRAEIAVPAGAAAAAAVPVQEDPERSAVLEPARRTFVMFIGVLVGALLFAGLGFLALVAFIVFYAAGRLRGGIVTGHTVGGIYAETFAVWIGLFLGLLALVGAVESLNMITGAGLAMALSLAAVAWPVLRGLPWRQVREDIGWTLGRQPLLEPLIGVMWYVMALPLVVAGVGLTVALMFLQRALTDTGAGDPLAPVTGPTHPVIEFLSGDDAGLRLQVILLASVIAPIVEETMFRGVLYRHLREASALWRPAWSALFSATVASFIFAVVHPQGLVAVPVLMALAYGFSAAREWRGTLIPAMVGHGLNNALVTTFAAYALS